MSPNGKLALNIKIAKAQILEDGLSIGVTSVSSVAEGSVQALVGGPVDDSFAQ